MRSSLLQAIRETPEDDAPRLVYADWLEEHGDEADRERAEFIRLQVRLAVLNKDDPERLILAARERALLGKHRGAWVADFPQWARGWVEFRRGMPFHLATTAGQFLRRGKAIMRDHFVEGVTLGNALGQVPKLTSSGLLAGIRALALKYGDRYSGNLSPADGAALVACPDLAGVVCLDLSEGRLEVKQLRALLTSEYLPNLRELRLGVAGTGSLGAVAARERPGLRTLIAPSAETAPAECEALSRSPGMSELHTLDLSHCHLKDKGVAALAQGSALRRLRRLNLDQNELKAGAVRALAESPHLGQLTHLSLEFCSFGDEGPESLAGSPNFARLQELNLDATDIAPAGLVRLARSRHLRGLGRLDLGYSNLDRPAAEELGRSDLLANVTDLRIGGARVDAGATAALLRSPAVRRVRFLDAGVNPMTDDLIAAIGGSPYLTRLEGLFLGQSRLNDAHAQALAGFANLSSLKVLDLAWNHIGTAGGRAVAASPYLGSLALLAVGENPMEGDAALYGRFGDRVRYSLRYQG